MDSNTCCQELPDWRNQRSPFQRILSFGYYDGTTAGVAQCVGCSVAYKYDLLAWDEDQDMRIFGLAPLPSGSFSELLAASAVLGEPRWPTWVPVWQFSSETIQNKVESRIQAVLNKAGPLTFVVATNDISNNFVAGKRITETNVELVQGLISKSVDVQEWLAFLGER